MRILVFDSGLGGLTVFRELRKAIPMAHFFYIADDAGFPYGARPADDLIWRILNFMRKYTAEIKPDAVVIACNTAATLVLPHLRAAFPKLPFIGTVPAIKPAAERTKSGLISVLATPGTVMRDYTRDLIASFAAHCRVTLVGSKHLAALAEDFMQGRAISDADVAAELAPCFVEAEDGRRTDQIVLACTHYPLLLQKFVAITEASPQFWRVAWIDPAPAIARHTAKIAASLADAGVTDDASDRDAMIFTSGVKPDAAFAAVLADFGFRLSENTGPA